MLIFNHPEKVNISKIIQFYLKQEKLNKTKSIVTAIKNSFIENESKLFEEDIVFELN